MEEASDKAKIFDMVIQVFEYANVNTFLLSSTK
jgi:hypothetical protein